MLDVAVADLAPPPGLEVSPGRETPASDEPRERSPHPWREVPGWVDGCEGVAWFMSEAQVAALFAGAP